MPDHSADPPLNPTCRYGHGFLERVQPALDLPDWNVVAFTQSQNPDGGAEWHSRFSLLMYDCPHCGYVEFFDAGREGKIPLGRVE